MTWLAPAAWFGLGLLAVPVLVHLFSRRPPRTVPFPSLRLLAVSPPRPTRRTRVSDWPLLLLRLAIVAAAVLALAQPARRGGGAARDAVGARVRVVDTATVALADGPAPAPPAAPGTPATDAGAVAGTVAGPLPEAIASAISTLRTQPAPRALDVVSAFPAGLVDSALFAAIPRDVVLTLTRVAPRAPAPRTDTMAWVTARPRDDVQRVVDAVTRLQGAPVVVLAPGSRVRRPIAISVGATANDTGVAWLPAATATLQRLVHDDVLPRHFAAAPPLPARERTGGIALVHDARGRPTLAAFPTATGLQLVMADDPPTRALGALLAAGGSAPRRPTGPSVDAATLARWQRLPAAAPIGDGLARADVHRVPTLARWGWLVVLVLLGAESALRRRAAARTAHDGPEVAA